MHTRLSLPFLGTALDSIDAAVYNATAFDYMGAWCAGGEL